MECRNVKEIEYLTERMNKTLMEMDRAGAKRITKDIVRKNFETMIDYFKNFDTQGE